MAASSTNNPLDTKDEKENISNNSGPVNSMFEKDSGFLDTMPDASLIQENSSSNDLSQRTVPELAEMQQRYRKAEFEFAKNALLELGIEVGSEFCVYNARKLGLMRSFDENFNNSNNVIVNNNMNNIT